MPAPIDVQLTGPNVQQNYELARTLLPHLQAVPGAADVHIQQGYDQPQLDITVDRTKAQQVGMTQSVVANNALVSLSNSFPDRAELLGQPAGRDLQRRHADAAVPHGFRGDLRGMPVIGGTRCAPAVAAAG